MTKARFAVLLTIPALALGACGGDDISSDEDLISGIVEEVSTDPAAICDHLSADSLRQLGGREECLRMGADERGSDASIDDLQIDGDSASAEITDADGKTTVRFVKEDGDWKVVG